MEYEQNYSRRRRSKKDKFKKRLVCWVLTIVISLIFLIAGNALFKNKINLFNVANATAEKAKIIEMGAFVEDSADMGGDATYESTYQYFTAKILSGENKGTEVYAVQTLDNLGQGDEDPVELGDKVILYNYDTEIGDAYYVFGGYDRFSPVVIFIIIFCILLLIFGRIKGFNTIVSLAFTCLAVFMVFIPGVLAGSNVYFLTSLICIYIIVMTLMIVLGPSKKCLTTIIGCTFGVLVSAILILIWDKIVALTGIIDENSVYLTYYDPPLNLNALIFAMVVIGALGAVMDVAMDISSSLAELHIKAPHLTFKELYKSGITIGRDVMGTMANTLVLAYIGSSLCCILLMVTYTSSLLELLNRETIIVELLNGLIGSVSILLTIPLTSLVCAFVYTYKGDKLPANFTDM